MASIEALKLNGARWKLAGFLQQNAVLQTFEERPGDAVLVIALRPDKSANQSASFLRRVFARNSELAKALSAFSMRHGEVSLREFSAGGGEAHKDFGNGLDGEIFGEFDQSHVLIDDPSELGEGKVEGKVASCLALN